MEQTTTTAYEPSKVVVRQCIVMAVIFTFMLFFLDSDTRSVAVLADVWNWVWFAIYVFALLAGQCIANLVILARYKGNEKNFLTHAIGLPIGVALLVLLFRCAG